MVLVHSDSWVKVDGDSHHYSYYLVLKSVKGTVDIVSVIVHSFALVACSDADVSCGAWVVVVVITDSYCYCDLFHIDDECYWCCYNTHLHPNFSSLVDSGFTHVVSADVHTTVGIRCTHSLV